MRKVLTCLLLQSLSIPLIAQEDQKAYWADRKRAATELQGLIKTSTNSRPVVTIYALDPGKEPHRSVDSIGFHGWKIVGQKVLGDSKEQTALLDAVGLERTPGDTYSFCLFVPHHGVRIQFEKRVLDLVICYTCSEIEGHFENKKFGPFGIPGSSEFALSTLFKAHGLPSPKRNGAE